MTLAARGERGLTLEELAPVAIFGSSFFSAFWQDSVARRENDDKNAWVGFKYGESDKPNPALDAHLVRQRLLDPLDP